MKKLDYLGTECKFYFDECDTFQTKFGGIFTVILGVVMLLLFIFFGRDFYLRTNPLVIAEVGTYSYYPDYYLSNANFTVVVGIETEKNDVLEDESEIYLEFYLYSYQYKDESSRLKKEPYPLVKCNASHFSNDKESNADRFKRHKCVDLNSLYVGGFWDSNSIFYISFNVNRCSKGRRSRNGTKCSDSPTIDQQYYFSIYTQTYRVSPSDYVSPLKYSIKNESAMVDERLKKYLKYYYQEIIVKTDYGWLFEETVTERALSYNFDQSDFASYDPKTEMLIIADLYFINNFTSYNRVYSKVQSLAANVGGVMKLLVFIGVVFVNKYSLYKLRLEMFKNWAKKNVQEMEDKFQPKNVMVDNFLFPSNFTKKQSHNEKNQNLSLVTSNQNLGASIHKKFSISPDLEIKISFIRVLLGSMFKRFQDKNYFLYVHINKMLTICLDYRNLIDGSKTEKTTQNCQGN